MLSIQPGNQMCMVRTSQTAKLMWSDWFRSVPPGHLCQLEVEQACPWQSRWIGEKETYCACCFTVMFGLPAAGSVAQSGRFMLWCCQIGWLTDYIYSGCKIPMMFLRWPIAVQTLLLVQTVTRWYKKKKNQKIIITPSLLLLLIPPFLFTVFYL